MAEFNVAAGTRSQPIFVPAGSLVTVYPAQGASAKVEYTKGSVAEVNNGVATWANWAKGASVSATTSDLLNEPAYLRVTATGADVTLTVSENAAGSVLDPFRYDWGSQQGSVGSASSVIAQSGVASSVTGTTSETTLATVTIPGGTMGPNSSIRITSLFTCSGANGTRTPRIKFGGTLFYGPGALAATTVSIQSQQIVRNRNSQAAQIAFTSTAHSPLSASASANVTAAVDTYVDQQITISMQLGSALDTVTLEGYTVELLP